METASKSTLNSNQTPELESQEQDTESQDEQEYVNNLSNMYSQSFCGCKVQFCIYISPSLPSSPPPKAEAFEDFKSGQGSKINSILKENKMVLLERHSLLRQLTEEVNAVKREMDFTAAAIQRNKEMTGGTSVCVAQGKLKQWFHPQTFFIVCF